MHSKIDILFNSKRVLNSSHRSYQCIHGLWIDIMTVQIIVSSEFQHKLIYAHSINVTNLSHCPVPSFIYLSNCECYIFLVYYSSLATFYTLQGWFGLGAGCRMSDSGWKYWIFLWILNLTRAKNCDSDRWQWTLKLTFHWTYMQRQTFHPNLFT